MLFFAILRRCFVKKHRTLEETRCLERLPAAEGFAEKIKNFPENFLRTFRFRWRIVLKRFLYPWLGSVFSTRSSS